MSLLIAFATFLPALRQSFASEDQLSVFLNQKDPPLFSTDLLRSRTLSILQGILLFLYGSFFLGAVL